MFTKTRLHGYPDSDSHQCEPGLKHRNDLERGRVSQMTATRDVTDGFGFVL